MIEVDKVKLNKGIENELVRYSRAGDIFHYRWAARRCLRMIYPKSLLRCVVIEGSGSKKRELAGEYVIDITEYSDSTESDLQEIGYYQLKHTTVRKGRPFNLSDLKDTIIGFAERYSEHFINTGDPQEYSRITFSIVTNRPIAKTFKQNVFAISRGEKANSRFQKTFEKYSNLSGEHLKKFSALLIFTDNEGDYETQQQELIAEISVLLAGTIDTPQVESIVALVQEKALPKTDGRIYREDILKRFGCQSERDLYPALPELEELDNPIPREQHEFLRENVLNAEMPIIIHAAGGVGKSIFARQLTKSLPVGSLGVIYDCFGGGRYLNRSELRHRHRDGLIQIVNELAAYGLCEPLIAQSYALEDEILRKFLTRIKNAAETLREVEDSAVLVIIIDAADSAEMAAEKFGDNCFVHEVLRENLPIGCRIIALCRTERIQLLQPSYGVLKFELSPFSESESLIHLRSCFPQATEADGLEFYRLTNEGNPRVQANALSLGFKTVEETLSSLGPAGTSVDRQIHAQLNSAIVRIKENFPPDYQRKIDTICCCLASLPPLIPISVLARAAEVDEATIKSFVADLGRPLWISETSVQFRDEPTETWFKENFFATKDQITSFVSRLEPLAYEYSYVAETLPSLLLQAEKFRELINLALSDQFLPTDNPIDERNVRIYRLQFAFKAALKQGWFSDATKIALRCGEEMAGDKRQLEILLKNVDLIAPLQSEQRVQELAFRRLLKGGWDGSENIYSGALLSSVEDYKGEARGYLRAALNWLHIYFDQRNNNKTNHQEKLQDDEIVELGYIYFNLHGIHQLVEFFIGWKPPEVIYRITKKFVKRLIDVNNLIAIEEILQFDYRKSYVRYQYLVIAIADELLEIGQIPNVEVLRVCLDLLASKRTRLPKPDYPFTGLTISAIVSFLDACAVGKLPKEKILRVLKHYVGIRASSSVSNRFLPGERGSYFQATALRCVLESEFDPDFDDLVPKNWVDKNKPIYTHEQEIQEFKEMVEVLLPWYIVRAQMLVNNIDNYVDLIDVADQRAKKAQTKSWRDSGTIPFEISGILIDILTYWQSANTGQVEDFYNKFLKENTQIWIPDRLKVVRNAYRLNHLSGIKRQLERSANNVIISTKNESPESIAEWYINLARAVLPSSRDDAATYFNFGIKAVSKFGDEIVQRWEAVAALANRAADNESESPELAYRFIRCGELVGDNVAREKYWNRNEAIRICAKLSPVSALSAISRWRDRDVGWFNHQLPALAEELVKSSLISSSVGWSLSAFFEEYGLDDFAILCLERETSINRRSYILNAAIRNLRLNDATEKSWRKIKKVVQELSIENNVLDEILAFFTENPEKNTEELSSRIQKSNEQSNADKIDWGAIFDDLELYTGSGLNQAIERFNVAKIGFHDWETFWQEAYKRVDESNSNEILSILADTGVGDRYEIQNALRYFPNDWRSKVSIIQSWPNFLVKIARRFAPDLTNRYIYESFLEGLQVESDQVKYINLGIMNGLSQNSTPEDASTFFGFSAIVATFISPEEAIYLLDYALGRFELHIEDDYGDGRWENWLKPPNDICTALAGLIWSALGSPRAEMRWRAAHYVRGLADLECKQEINALIQWMETNIVGAFGSSKFPFYNLHARQYLLIALARISLDNPKILKPYSNLFSRYALENHPHILIQIFSAEIALNIEKAFPTTYSQDVVKKLQQVDETQLPIREIEKSGEKIPSYWHLRGEVDTSIEFIHGWDFDRYWYDPLGGLFGISGKQVEELATEIIVKEWGIKNDGSYDGDPRVSIWRTTQNERETWHDHGSYPRADNYSFYLSYHAMFVVAAKLLQKMPIVHKNDWDEVEWADWLHRHLLTRNDGRWLADRRDPAPLLQRDWINKIKSKTWRSEITADDFLDGILFKREGKTWLNVAGFWEERDNECEESYHISSALVSPTGSQSLLNALTTCPDPNDYKLPDYEDDEMEFVSRPLVLIGWLWKNYTDNRLDEYDPFAAEIAFPPYQVGESIIDKLNLSVEPEQREWFLPDSSNPSLICEIWSTNKNQYEERLRNGQRMGASFDFLMLLCSILGVELILKVEINRRYRERPYTRHEEKYEYKPPICKIYILSADGKFRDSETSYQLR